MAGRPKRIRNIQSYVNHIDAHTAAGPMKMGTAPRVGVTRNFWHNYQAVCHQSGDSIKQSYRNVVALGINPARTPVGTCFDVERSCSEELVPNMFPTPDSGGGTGTCQQCPTGPTGPAGGGGNGILTINEIGPDITSNFTVDASNGIAIGAIANGIYVSNTEGAAAFVVDQGGKGNYTTIQSAIDAAALVATATTQQTVYIWSGTYVENIALTPYINLIANSTFGVTINGTVTCTTTATEVNMSMNGIIIAPITGDALVVIAGNFFINIYFTDCKFFPVAGSCIVGNGDDPDGGGDLFMTNCELFIPGGSLGSTFNCTNVSFVSSLCTIVNNSTNSATFTQGIVTILGCVVQDNWVLNSIFALINNCNFTATKPSFFNSNNSGMFITNSSVTGGSTYWINGTGNLVYSGVVSINGFNLTISPTITQIAGNLQCGTLITHPGTSSDATSTFNSSPLVIGTPKQNTLVYDIQVNICVSVSSATGGTIVLGVGSSSTPTTNAVTPTFTIATTNFFTFTALVPTNYYILVDTTGTVTVDSITTQVCPI